MRVEDCVLQSLGELWNCVKDIEEAALGGEFAMIENGYAEDDVVE